MKDAKISAFAFLVLSIGLVIAGCQTSGVIGSPEEVARARENETRAMRIANDCSYEKLKYYALRTNETARDIAETAFLDCGDEWRKVEAAAYIYRAMIDQLPSRRPLAIARDVFVSDGIQMVVRIRASR